MAPWCTLARPRSSRPVIAERTVRREIAQCEPLRILAKAVDNVDAEVVEVGDSPLKSCVLFGVGSHAYASKIGDFASARGDAQHLLGGSSAALRSDALPSTLLPMATCAAPKGGRGSLFRPRADHAAWAARGDVLVGIASRRASTVSVRGSRLAEFVLLLSAIMHVGLAEPFAGSIFPASPAASPEGCGSMALRPLYHMKCIAGAGGMVAARKARWR